MSRSSSDERDPGQSSPGSLGYIVTSLRGSSNGRSGGPSGTRGPPMRHRSEAEAPTIAHPTALLVLACGSKTMHAHVNWAKLSRVHKAAKRGSGAKNASVLHG